MSGSMLLNRQNVIISDELLLPLAVDFVNPTLEHFDEIVWITDNFQRNSCFFSEQNRDAAGIWLLPFWENQLDCIEIGILLHFLLQSSYSDFPILADAFLKGKEVDDISQSNVSFSMNLDDGDSESFWIVSGQYASDGSLLEVMAQIPCMGTKAFIWFLDQCDISMHRGLLLAAAGFHVDFHIEGHTDQCVLKKILSGQADPNAAGYLVAPLQIAVATCDIEGVAELLEAGVDSNATGDQNGVSFKANSILE
jgi:hypothetical protein